MEVRKRSKLRKRPETSIRRPKNINALGLQEKEYHYVPMKRLNKFNRDVEYIHDFMGFLTMLLEADEKGITLSEEDMQKKFPPLTWSRKKWIHYKLSEGIRTMTIFEPYIYWKLQTVLRDITGKYWGAEEWVLFITSWFIIQYSNLNKPQEDFVLPFYRVKDMQRKILIKKIDKVFSKYYHTILKNK